MTTSYNIHVSTAELLKVMKNKMLMTSIKQVIEAYHSQEFKMQAILGDGQFKHIKQLIRQKGITKNICTTNEHMTELKIK